MYLLPRWPDETTEFGRFFLLFLRLFLRGPSKISTLCNLLQEKDPRRGQHGHLAVYNALEISHCKIPSRMVLRAHPFKHLPYHGKNRQDYAAWRPNYIDIPRDDYDPSDPQHPVAYVRLIMLFKCGICPAQGVSEEEHSLAFVEELWPYTPPREDILQSKYECDMLYTTKPTPAYYVVNINSLLSGHCRHYETSMYTYHST